MKNNNVLIFFHRSQKCVTDRLNPTAAICNLYFQLHGLQIHLINPVNCNASVNKKIQIKYGENQKEKYKKEYHFCILLETFYNFFILFQTFQKH